ncbi:MAG: shikimate kinase [Rhodothermales bacterium]|nr:shikimate kinase [Rhodothermales bacterium]
MASGKSALGRALASEIDFSFLDLDNAIEEREGRSISRIFSEDGESSFRKAEDAALRATGDLNDHVIAVGGGTLAAARNMDWALEHGTVIFLDLDVDEIVRRLIRSRRRRPLIDALRNSPGELERYVSRLLEERRPAYERAHISVRLERASLRRNARSLADILRRHLSDRRTGSKD